jgi:hypothetical protein
MRFFAPVYEMTLQRYHFSSRFRFSPFCSIGYIVPEVFRFPFDIAPGLACADVPNGVAAIDAIPALGWAQIFFLIGSVDYYGFLGDFDAGKPALDEETLATRQLNELQRKLFDALPIQTLLFDGF